MNEKELKIKLKDIIERKLKVCDEAQLSLNKWWNPVLKISMDLIFAEVIAFDSVLDAMNDDDVMLNRY